MQKFANWIKGKVFGKVFFLFYCARYSFQKNFSSLFSQVFFLVMKIFWGHKMSCAVHKTQHEDITTWLYLKFHALCFTWDVLIFLCTVHYWPTETAIIIISCYRSSSKKKYSPFRTQKSQRRWKFVSSHLATMWSNFWGTFQWYWVLINFISFLFFSFLFLNIYT